MDDKDGLDDQKKSAFWVGVFLRSLFYDEFKSNGATSKKDD